MIIDSWDSWLEDHLSYRAAGEASASLWRSSVWYVCMCVFIMQNHTCIHISLTHSNACRVFSLERSILQTVRNEAKQITQYFSKSISIAVWQQCMGSAIYHNIKSHHVKASNKKLEETGMGLQQFPY